MTTEEILKECAESLEAIEQDFPTTSKNPHTLHRCGQFIDKVMDRLLTLYLSNTEGLTEGYLGEMYDRLMVRLNVLNDNIHQHVLLS